ncbi:GNAT family N-acetyltransferase [Paenibacillus lycopersici]|uniref:GNAT family N-acetyltransferase n=1 Tax=Paenibacillus lycopersici TaxID=2704462 RepID=A0A6C0FRA9_9BACL|nr:GNAT family N-acetyltransferase [Paenibacillus lycopersici]QHT59407.1 GNAT family N-acetyltransferase [Paenibacillus lycopersici]
MIRTIRQEEARQSLELTQAAFAVKFTESGIEERAARMNMEQYLGYYADGRLAAQLAVLPLGVYVQGEEMAMGGIAHVASYPEMRRQGMVGKLLVHSLAAMRERGQAVSMLNPFAYGFYRKYGWEYYSVQRACTLDLSAAPKYPAAPGAVRRLQASDWAQAGAVYDRYARRYNGMLLRDENWWLQHVFKRKLGYLSVYVGGDGGQPTGYMLYDIGDRTMTIHELVYLDRESRNGLWQFIANHDSVVSRLRLTAPADDSLLFAMAEPKLQQELHANFMFRVVDAPAFLNRYRFAGGAARLRVRLEDEHAPWNRGLWQIAVSADGSAVASRVASAGQAAEDAAGDGIADREADSEWRASAEAGGNRRESGQAAGDGNAGAEAIDCTIQTFSAMMIGCMRPAQLADLGRLEGPPEAVDAWERAIPRRLPHMMDFF